METKRTITISRIRKSFDDMERRIYSSLDFFKDCEYFLFRDNGITLTISKCGLDTPKKAVRGCRVGDTISFHFSSDIPLGCYDVNEEESNEDRLVINYLNPKL